MAATHSQVMEAISVLRGFIGFSQLGAIAAACMEEQRDFYFEKLVEMGEIVKRMPKTREQEHLGDNAVIHLHYTNRSERSPSIVSHWWITEKDIGFPEHIGTKEEGAQHQAFGWSDNGEGPELGCISIVDLLGMGAELDLEWKPRTIFEVFSSTSK